MNSDLALAESMWLPQGPRPGADARLLVQGILLGYDATKRQATVSVNEGEGSTIPVLVDADWSSVVGFAVWVLRDSLTGRSVLVLGPCALVPVVEDPPPDPIVYPPQFGTVTAVAAGGITVSTTAGTIVCSSVVTTAAYVVNDVVVLMWATPDTAWVIGKRGAFAGAPGIPATPAAPTLSRSGTTVTVSWVKPANTNTTQVQYQVQGTSTWKTKSGITGSTTTVPVAQGQTLIVQVRAFGTSGASPYSPTSSVTYAVVTPPAPQLVTRTTRITPDWSGTWRAIRSDWDRWNVDRYGGRSTMYQGNAYGSGDLTGLCVYGSRLSSLHAVDITSIVVTVRGAGVASATVRLQGSSNGSKPSGAPNASGATVNATPGTSGTDKVSLPSSMCDAFRTGAIKGLVTNGAGYTAVRGTSLADGMALKVTYTMYA